ncbi:MAG: VOC family protein [Desulfobacteraceae bacterium]|nr:VOC family protein [Desulfobacteraceae bacterium]
MGKSFITANTILYCSKWKETVHFYKDHLGLEINFSSDWFVEFRLAGCSRLSIADEKRTSIKSCSGGGITLALEVKDIEASYKFLKATGLEPTEIRNHPWGAKVFYIYDPEGHRIEIWQPNLTNTSHK